MNNIAHIYRAELLRAAFGPGARPDQAHDLHRLNQFAERLAECEEAQTILRAKGYGLVGASILDAVRSVPENVRQVLKNLFKTRPVERAPDISDAHEPWKVH